MPGVPASGGCPEFRSQQVNRREVLRVGGLSLLGLSLPHLFAAEARASSLGEKPAARARSCIFLFLPGGPSQHETFDPKPDAPSDCRSIFGTTQTQVPGIQLCEHLSGLAPLAEQFSLVRSVWHQYTGHFGGHRYALSGFPAPGNADQPARPDDKPGIIALAARNLAAKGSFPPTIMLPWLATDQGNSASGGMGAGTLGKRYDPLLVEADMAGLDLPGRRKETSTPSKGIAFRVPEFSLQAGITPERFDGRRSLLDQIENERRGLREAADHQQMNDLYRKAYDLLSSPKVKEGFDVDQEDDKLREKYGQNAFGQSCLLARRLVERGARFVQVNFCRFVTQKGYGWDTHDKGQETLKDQLLPKLNSGLASLLEDLRDRGLLDETLVVCMGEFGRTPKVKKDGGRDHWPNCYSMLLAGGGIRGGQVYGRSDKIAAYPANDPVEARDILVTVLTLLGIPTFSTDVQGRAAPLFEGAQAIERLIG